MCTGTAALHTGKPSKAAISTFLSQNVRPMAIRAQAVSLAHFSWLVLTLSHTNSLSLSHTHTHTYTHTHTLSLSRSLSPTLSSTLSRDGGQSPGGVHRALQLAGAHPKPGTRNPKPGTRNLKPGARDLKLGIRNPKSGSRLSKPGT